MQRCLAAPSALIFFAKNTATIQFLAPRAPGGTLAGAPHPPTPEQQHRRAVLRTPCRPPPAACLWCCCLCKNKSIKTHFLPWLGKQGQDSFSFPPCKPYCQLQRTRQTSHHTAAHHAKTSMQLIGASFGSASPLLLLPLAIKRERIQDDVPPSNQDLRMQHSS